MTTRKNKKDKEDLDFDEEIVDHLIKCRDIDNLIIKGHLVIEHAIDNYIINHSISKVNFNKLKLGFTVKIEIAKILGLFIYDDDLYCKLISLNKVRNSIAHNLSLQDHILADFFKIADNESLLINKYRKSTDLSVNTGNGESYKINVDHFRYALCIATIYGQISEFSNFTLSDILKIKTRFESNLSKKL